MKRRKTVYFFLLAAVILTALIICFQRKKPILLGERYPAISQGTYQASIEWDGQPAGSIMDAKVSDEEFRDILASAHVAKHKTAMQQPPVAFAIHLTYEKTSYSIVVGSDHTISVAQEDLRKTRIFWADLDETVFDSLYACHQNNDGVVYAQIESLLKK